MRRLILFAAILTLFFVSPSGAKAISGACSSHSGVNCSAGADLDGSVICNDGWGDSSVKYTDADECKTTFTCTNENELGALRARLGVQRGLGYSSASETLINQCVEDIERYKRYQEAQTLLRDQSQVNNFSPAAQCYMIDEGYYSRLDGTDGTYYDNQCSYLTRESFDKSLVQIFGGLCGWSASEVNFAKLRAKALEYIILAKQGLLTKENEETIIQESARQICPDRLCTPFNLDAEHTLYKKNNVEYYDAKCTVTRDLSLEGKIVEAYRSKCVEYSFNQLLIYNIKLGNLQNWLEKLPDKCINSTKSIISSDQTIKEIKQSSALSNKLKGRILLQVEGSGEAWYVHPESGNRFYMRDGTTAYQMMRSFGLGITDSDLNKIPSVEGETSMKQATSLCQTNSVANRVRGRILLQVQQNGEAWYVDPDKCRRIYMKDGSTAYQIMRFLSLGITNSDLKKIQEDGL